MLHIYANIVQIILSPGTSNNIGQPILSDIPSDTVIYWLILLIGFYCIFCVIEQHNIRKLDWREKSYKTNSFLTGVKKTNKQQKKKHVDTKHF